MSKLPCAKCKGQCCTYPAFSPWEFKAVEDKIPEGAKVVDFPGGAKTVFFPEKGGVCAWLGPQGCEIFSQRPLTCKLYGEIPELPCQYLYPEQAMKNMNKRLGL